MVRPYCRGHNIPEHMENQVGIPWKLHSYRLVFTVLEGPMQRDSMSLGGGEQNTNMKLVGKCEAVYSCRESMRWTLFQTYLYLGMHIKYF